MDEDFMKPVQAIGPLAEIVGTMPMPRTEITAKVWAYVKRNDLQDKKNRRMLNADAKLRKLFGGKAQVSMFDLTEYVSKYLEVSGDDRSELPKSSTKGAAKSQVVAEDFEPTSDEETLNARVRKLMRVRGLKEPIGIAKPKRTKQSGTGFVRAPDVKAWVLLKAKGSCEACGSKAPFKTDAGDPFLETHHVIPLADGGPDTTSNSVAVCPNCHRRLHMSADRDQFRSKLCQAVKRLSVSEYGMVRAIANGHTVRRLSTA